MAQTDEGVCNLALKKLGAGSISTLSAPTTPVERTLALIYPQYRDEELQKRMWLCAIERARLTQTRTLDGDEQPFGYQMPNDCIRLIRRDGDTWTRRGRTLWSEQSGGINIEYVRRITAGEMDPLLVGVIAMRIALEACEELTQSNEKKKFCDGWYRDAVNAAGQANAFERAADQISDDDNTFSWITARSNGGM